MTEPVGGGRRGVGGGGGGGGGGGWVQSGADCSSTTGSHTRSAGLHHSPLCSAIPRCPAHLRPAGPRRSSSPHAKNNLRPHGAANRELMEPDEGGRRRTPSGCASASPQIGIRRCHLSSTC
ncbi:hypothetical protein Q5P01_007810 [Channa striata]|uniref:Uncharacterized protein n=1 Tax=Channa striata TaxID=64152 RepID=A0AA88N4A2_CHASR|nr:hypothetical protein Q5P01_007810 [Channa striata]